MKEKYFKRKLLALLCAFIVAVGQYIYFSDFFNQSERFVVTLDHCVDGDTAWFILDGEKIKCRFLYIDTPESTNKKEKFGKEASQYTKTQLQNASLIEVEFNKDGDQYDKYDRALWWVFVDGELLQEKIAREGYVKKYYDYGYHYKYKEQIIKADKQAQKEKRGIYQ
jgi:Micrococcal nuclease (thermonuclease) homologs